MPKQDRNPDHAQAWIDLVCHAAQALGAEAFYRWLLMVGQGTDEERTRKGRAFLDLQTGGGKLTDEVRIPENFKLVPHDTPVYERPKDIDRFKLNNKTDLGAKVQALAGKIADERWVEEFCHSVSTGADGRLSTFSAMMVDSLVNDRKPLDANDLTWARTTAWALGYTDGPTPAAQTESEMHY